MQKAKKSFISSTFWSERVGFLAGLYNLEILEKKKPFENLIKVGKFLNYSWENLAKKYNLKISISGIETISSFNFISKNNSLYRTYITQEMLKKGYLASNVVYLNIYHNKNVISNYIKNLDPIFKKISLFENKKIKKIGLNGPISGFRFKRINDH
jgi:glutamate-1-semialdehyde aminotransferase